ncbi:SgcJ/EcaC family oxidoreductase [Microbacterium sp. DT81.1]|uniref:SgcJ/EcaC family oxidoreductase n=1 Tax=Microbacterium sp. DT81.1 TaxID=3393413 RepID=UPI003CF88153
MTPEYHSHLATDEHGRRGGDEGAVRELFRRLLEAWAAGDAERYGALFTEDADYVAFDGVNQKGRAAIVGGHRPLFEKWLKGSALTGEVTGVRFLAPDVALVHASGGTLLKGKKKPDATRRSIQSLVAVNGEDGWRFTSFHNTRVRGIGSFQGVLLWKMTDTLWRLFGPR